MLVTCQSFGDFVFIWSGSILQFRQNMIKVGLKSLLLTCRSNIPLSLPSYTGSALKRELIFCNGYLSLLYFCILAWKCNLIKKWLQLMILKLLSECCTLMQFIAVGARGLGAVPPPILGRSVTLSPAGGRLRPPHYYVPPTYFQTFLRPCKCIQGQWCPRTFCIHDLPALCSHMYIFLVPTGWFLKTILQITF
jgi:hypothetical protein